MLTSPSSGTPSSVMGSLSQSLDHFTALRVHGLKSDSLIKLETQKADLYGRTIADLETEINACIYRVRKSRFNPRTGRRQTDDTNVHAPAH